MISPFASEDEAREYEKTVTEKIANNPDINKYFHGRPSEYTEQELMKLAEISSHFSFDYSFQTGLCLAKRITNKPGKYQFVIRAHNKVIPYETYAMHHGALREEYFSPPNDLNHYDTIHAEVSLLIEYTRYLEQPEKDRKNIKNLRGTTLFINLMPCPSCARMLAATDIEEFVYEVDHSDGYALKLLEQAGKKVRRLVI